MKVYVDNSFNTTCSTDVNRVRVTSHEEKYSSKAKAGRFHSFHRTTDQLHCHQQARQLSVLTDRWREIPRHLTGSWHVKDADWFTGLFEYSCNKEGFNAVGT